MRSLCVEKMRKRGILVVMITVIIINNDIVIVMYESNDNSDIKQYDTEERRNFTKIIKIKTILNRNCHINVKQYIIIHNSILRDIMII